MKKFATIASAALLAMSGLFGTACSTKANAVEDESSSVKKTFNVTGFTEVDAGHQFEVDIKTGGSFAVAVYAPDDAFQYIKLFRKGERLLVEWDDRDNSFFNRRYNNHASVKVTVTMPVLNRVLAHGQSQFTLRGTGFGDKLAFETTGQARLTIIDNIATTQLSVGTSGQSVFRCKDVTAADINAGCSGQSVANLGFVTATDVSLTTSGQSAINIATCKADALNADASGQSAINIPTSDIRSLSRSTSGQSAINL